MKIIVTLLVMLGAGLGVAWLISEERPPEPTCRDPLGCVELMPGEPLHIGVIQALSGKVARLGQDQVRGLELALERRQGVILGHPVSLVVEDTGCRPEGGAIAALKIVSDPSVAAIFGTTCSADAATAAEVMSEAGLTMISGNNSAPFLTSTAGQKAPKWQAGYFRTAPNEEHSGPAAARFAFEHLGIRQAATINDGDIYTQGLTDGFQKEFTRLGGTLVLAATVNKGDTDMGPVLQAVLQAKAQLVFFPLFQPEGNQVLLAARANPAYDAIVMMSDGSLIEDSFIQSVGAACQGMYFVGPTPPVASAALRDILARYKSRYGESPPSNYYTNAYDAANILFSAIENAAINKDGKMILGRKALRDAIYGTQNAVGLAGVLGCNQFGDCAEPKFNVLKMRDPSAGIQDLTSNVMYTYDPNASIRR